MRHYWIQIFIKAFWDSLSLFDQNPRLLSLFVIGALVTAALVRLFRGPEAFREHLKANILLAFAGGIITWLLFFPYFIARAPFDLFADMQSQLKASQERERAAGLARGSAELQLRQATKDLLRLQQQQKKTFSAGGGTSAPSKAIAAISHIVERGNAIQADWLRTNDTDKLKNDYGPWIHSAENNLQWLVGSSYVAQFNNAHGTASMGCPNAHTVEGCGYWQEISGKNQALMNAITELRGHH